MERLQDKSKYDDYRALMYYRQSIICQWLDAGNRVVPCLRHRIPNKELIDIMQPGEHAKYRGLQICKMLWLCPSCASKAARSRRTGMQRAIDHMRKQGYQLAFTTYTVRHRIDDSLAQVLGWVLAAHRALHSGKSWVGLERRFGWGGSIKSIEILYGANGWHAHLHEIGFIDRSIKIDQLEIELQGRWHRALANCGADADREIGLQCKPAQASIRDYISKWGIVPELASGADKKSRRGGILPFQLPDALLIDRAQGRHQRELFREYAAATKGAKQIWASPSIRPFMKKADDIAPDPEDRALEPLASLNIDQWRAIRRQGLRAELLRAAENGALTEFLMQIKI